MTAPKLREDDLSLCTEMVREQAFDLYLSDLLLPPKPRKAALVLHAFHVEAVNITLATNEPMAGEIRLQWWSEVLAGNRTGEAAGHPLARALLAIVETHTLPVAALKAKLEAHIFDLYRDPMESRTMLEGWCGETRSVLFQLVSMAGGEEPGPQLADACGHAGVAAGIVGILENTALHRRRGQIYVPGDMLAALGATSESYLSDENSEDVFQAMIDLARQHLSAAQTNMASLSKDCTAIFLPLALLPLYLNRAEKSLPSIATGLAPVAQWRKQWALWRAQ